jgi:hypothetical protein
MFSPSQIARFYDRPHPAARSKFSGAIGDAQRRIRRDHFAALVWEGSAQDIDMDRPRECVTDRFPQEKIEFASTEKATRPPNSATRQCCGHSMVQGPVTAAIRARPGPYFIE